MSLEFLVRYLDMPRPEDADNTQSSTPTIHTRYEQLITLINATMNNARPPTLILLKEDTEVPHAEYYGAPTECYRDYKSGKQRPTDFAPSEISITPIQYRLAQGQPAGASTALYERMAKETLEPHLAPISFSLGLCNERHILQESICPSPHCIVFHKCLEPVPTHTTALVAPISECFL